ncbi:endo alpha-1,4 polygalactosaminidase [Schlegelella sp. S2-27]|uniref:Endo alpha-1,4 polygalactosaminidase n=1 Tax=Caldimonas mangrovi TaxID=2944811 RepID=A0ABT0YTK7_9BURK|nr:endo alpha-1,4 polygalactosaminidase [Caldimonas mangrovi]MCM5681436.1 endo alpha-1,4 polygalactosaminidase [Caldimonas mangrovi]
MRAHIWFDRRGRYGRLRHSAVCAAATVLLLALAAWLGWFPVAGPDVAHLDGAVAYHPPRADGHVTVSRVDRPAGIEAQRVRNLEARTLNDPGGPGAEAHDDVEPGAVPGTAGGRPGKDGQDAARAIGPTALRNERVADDEEGPARWTPRLTDTWHVQLTGIVQMHGGVDVYVVDLFDVPQATLQMLRAARKHVVCMFSAGVAESWRPDYGRFLPADVGAPVAEGPGEWWLDTRSANVREIMKARLDHAVARGCDAVGLDAADGYTNSPGLELNALTQLDFNRFMALHAASKGLAVGLKNDVEQLMQLEPHFDFAINEQCHEYDECLGYDAFVASDKPVFNVEYDARYVIDAAARAGLCARARAAQLRTLVLPHALDGSFRFSCDAAMP